MRILTLLALSALSLATTAPAFAEEAMMKDGMHHGAMVHMSAADTRRMQTCNAMSHDRMMRSASCRRVARMHPDMMHHDSMMKHDGAMAHDSMMKSGN
ncbi:hypothetical protein [Novosphingobium lentum]|uniref:hypothetical protein n=1 Tax=Novosphingobium lentum TaxID=145287 RepID=UPI000830BE17|nr:hypothetical protein [Novosphingobium lentum]